MFPSCVPANSKKPERKAQQLKASEPIKRNTWEQAGDKNAI
jgi:hypothetical protein